MIRLKGPAGITIVAGICLLLPTAISLGGLGCGPSITSPGPILLVIPMMVWTPVYFLILVPTVFFWLWSSYLFEGLTILPTRTKLLGYLIAVLSLTYYAANWGYGKRYQGIIFTIVCVAISLSFAILFIITVKRNEKNKTFFSNLVATWLIFVWVFTYAFPYLGETP
jgi:hypothetical protein